MYKHRAIMWSLLSCKCSLFAVFRKWIKMKKKLKVCSAPELFNVYATSRFMVWGYVMQYEQNAFAMSILYQKRWKNWYLPMHKNERPKIFYFLYYCFVGGILLIRHYFPGHHMFSGDSSGLIIVWDTPVRGSSPHLFQHWKVNKVNRFLN